jgi:hypothetical protein
VIAQVISLHEWAGSEKGKRLIKAMEETREKLGLVTEDAIHNGKVSCGAF